MNFFFIEWNRPLSSIQEMGSFVILLHLLLQFNRKVKNIQEKIGYFSWNQGRH